MFPKCVKYGPLESMRFYLAEMGRFDFPISLEYDQVHQMLYSDYEQAGFSHALKMTHRLVRYDDHECFFRAQRTA